jgi:UDP-GlcNAc:undecaprenyl-phosphate/decaprenyl-phosphate GlcNAc-1-phosphate transferase
MHISLLTSSIVAVSVTLTLLLVLQPVALRFHLVDQSCAHKNQSNNIPLIGGIAMFGAYYLSVLILNSSLFGFQPFFYASAILVFIGILDDRHQVSVFTRFMFQVIAVLLVALWGNISLTELGDLLFMGNIVLGVMVIPFTIFAVVGVINALNMADGVDGLASGYSVVALGGMALLASDEHWQTERTMLVLLIAVIVGFMFFNVRSPWCKRAKVFMGDAGSMFLGFALACAFIRLSQGETYLIAPVTALWLFALPLMDTVTIIIRRIRKGQSPFQPDHEHFHHILQRAGYTTGQSVLIMWGMSIVLAGFGIAGLLYGIHDGIMFTAFLGLFVLYSWAMSHAWRVMRFLHRPIS